MLRYSAREKKLFSKMDCVLLEITERESKKAAFNLQFPESRGKLFSAQEFIKKNES